MLEIVGITIVVVNEGGVVISFVIVVSIVNYSLTRVRLRYNFHCIV